MTGWSGKRLTVAPGMNFPALETANPLTYPGWDNLLLGNKGYSFFHSSIWARVLNESYGFTPVYFTSVANGRLETLVPLMEIKGIVFAGKRGVSLPFTDYCEPIIPAGGFLRCAMDVLIGYGRRAGWRTLEIRGGGDELEGMPPSSFFYGHTIDLSKSEEELFSSLRDSTKRNIRKALKEGVKVSRSRTPESMGEFYRLHCLTRKRHGLPPQPYSFFRKIYQHILDKNLGFVSLALHNGRVVAAAVYFHLGSKAIYKYGASDMHYQGLRANNLIMWEAIKWFGRNGFTEFCFGRTEPENRGLLQFKAGWGARQRTIKYRRFDLAQNAFVQGTPRSFSNSFPNVLFRRLPVPLLKTVGSLLYRYMG